MTQGFIVDVFSIINELEVHLFTTKGIVSLFQ